MAWSAPIWFDLWLAGMAGGAYFAAFLADRFTGGGNRQLLRLATYVGIPLAVIGVLLLIVDLGQPIRFWHLLTIFRVTSPMSMGTWILLAWVAIAVVLVILWWVERLLTEEVARNLRRLSALLAGINVIFAVLLITYTGVLLAVSSQSLWVGTILLPALFVASAISTGVATVIIAAITTNAISRGGFPELKVALNQLFGTTDWAVPNRMIGRLAEADAIVIVIELVALIGYAIWLASSSLAGAGAALGILLGGALAAPFWVGVVLLALLIPLWIDVANWGKELETKRVVGAIVFSSLSVLVGGLILRAVITIGGQI